MLMRKQLKLQRTLLLNPERQVLPVEVAATVLEEVAVLLVQVGRAERTGEAREEKTPEVMNEPHT
jgi:hypothetical protein